MKTLANMDIQNMQRLKTQMTKAKRKRSTAKRKI